ncbi:MAG: transpeptidase family protein [Rikenellaceae bacterium]|nr:transpeptidase family protein [Rikenellaceae bacterium]
MATDRNKQPSPIKSTIRRRVQTLYMIMLAVGVLILGKILYIQFGPDGDDLRDKGKSVNFSFFRQEAMRGDIYSKDMELIATSQKRYTVGIDFGVEDFIKNQYFSKHYVKLSGQMAEMFGGSPAMWQQRLKTAYDRYVRDKTPRYFKLTPRLISYEELVRMRSFALLNLPPNKGGRSEDDEIVRVRPFGELAARTIGKTTTTPVKVERPSELSDTTTKTRTEMEVKPISGLEQSFNHRLKGVNGWQLRQKINSRFWQPVESPHNLDPKDGCDVITTLDMDVQDIAETMLSHQILTNRADWGCAVVMETATGNIRAMANLTRYEDRCVEDRNYAVGGRFEPGSTFKLASLLALLELADYQLTDSVDVEGGVAIIDKRSYKDDHTGYDMISVKDMFAQSSNIGFVKSIREEFRDDPMDFVDFLGQLGMRDTLDICLNGEAKPMMWSPKDKGANQWIPNLTLNKMAYGYGFEISPLPTRTLFHAVANNGVMVRPRLVTEVSRYGESIEEFPVEYINKKICSDATITKARECLESVVDAGTGRILRNDYYTVAAKTGTSQMLFTDGTASKYNPYVDVNGRRQYLATMVGYFPADAPKYSIIVCMKSYTGNTFNYYGAGLAGPVFRAVADRLYASHTEWQPTVETKVKSDTVEREFKPAPIKGGDYKAVRRVIRELDVPLCDESEREQWVKTSRDSAQVVVGDLNIPENLVPNVIGMGAKDALYVLESRGMHVTLEGVGVVVGQSVPSGTTLQRGQHITLRLRR